MYIFYIKKQNQLYSSKQITTIVWKYLVKKINGEYKKMEPKAAIVTFTLFSFVVPPLALKSASWLPKKIDIEEPQG